MVQLPKLFTKAVMVWLSHIITSVRPAASINNDKSNNVRMYVHISQSECNRTLSKTF